MAHLPPVFFGLFRTHFISTSRMQKKINYGYDPAGKAIEPALG